jgi:ABC-type antimicrobial peptide transport system permease subunit
MGDPSNLIVPLRRLVVNGRTSLPYVRVRPYVDLLQRQVQPWRLGATLLTMFSALAVAVAAMGMYAAFAHAVVERRREMAIRVAVGASPARVVAMILREALRLSAVGIVVGTAGALIAGRSVQSILFGIVPADPLVLGGAAAAMLIVVAIATSLPARTASRADPNALLRAE